MKFVALFAAGAVASLVPRAEVDAIQEDIANLRTVVQAFTADALSYNDKDIQTLRQDAKAIIQAINAADSDTKALKGPLSDPDSASLAIPIQDLGQDIGKAIDTLIANKPALIAACRGPEVYQSLVDQNMQTAAFEKDLMARVSAQNLPLAKQIAKPINDNIARGIAAFSDQENIKCAAQKPLTISSIYGAVYTSTVIVAKPTSTSKPADSTPAPGSSDSGQSQAASSSALSSNSTSATYTGPAPTSTIVPGSASTMGASFGIAILAALTVFAL